MAFFDLGAKISGLARTVKADLGELMQHLWLALNGKGSPERAAHAVELQARQSAFLSFEAGAQAQHSELGGGKLPDAYHVVNAAAAIRQGGIVAARAKIVLAERPETYIAPYVDIASQVLTTGAARSGTRAAGAYNGARRKQFVRLRPVQEPRSHSTLEGTILLADELFNINGYLVYGPGDDALPWSEKAYCGHILKWIK